MSHEVRSGYRPRGDEDASDPANVLLLAPADRGPTLCAEHAIHDGEDDVGVVSIRFRSRSVEPAAAWSKAESRWPAALSVIDVGEGSTTRDRRRVRERAPEDVAVDYVDHRDDLVLVGIEVAETLGSMRERHDRVVLCVDSLTPLVRRAGLDRAYRFLHVMTEDVRRRDVVAHYHLDPNAHDLRTTYLLETLADAFVVAGDVDIAPPLE